MIAINSNKYQVASLYREYKVNQLKRRKCRIIIRIDNYNQSKKDLSINQFNMNNYIMLSTNINSPQKDFRVLIHLKIWLKFLILIAKANSANIILTYNKMSLTLNSLT